MKKVYRQLLSFLMAAAVLIGAGTIVNTKMSQASGDEKQDAKAGTMEVHFIDVGQGDSTLITCEGHAMLIDTGEATKGTAIQNYLQKQKIDKLDYLILTHPDSDHIGGAPVIITKFQIDKVFTSNYEKDNKTYMKLIQALDNKRLKQTTPKVGTKYSLGTAEFTILAPNNTYRNPNDASIALLLQNGKNRFLFTGDAEEDAEQDILENGLDISADVYKAGHHGSRTATSEKFFEAVSPSSAVISCGEDNSYGHPHAQTLNTFRMNGVKVYRTDEEGTIIATSDGEKITFSVPESDTWQAGEPNGTGAVWNHTKPSAGESEAAKDEVTYILNTKSNKFHKPSCNALPEDENREDSSESRSSIIEQGYKPCKRCNP